MLTGYLNMEIRFEGKRALVTGAGRGIGRDIAKALAAAGAEVVAVSRTQATLDSLKAECAHIQTICCDLSDWTATREALNGVAPIHLLVNNAGVNVLQGFMDITEEAIDQVFDVNVKAVINVSQIVAKGMIERGEGGAIVNISSQASQRAMAVHAAYSTTKAGLDMLTKCMAYELGRHKIRVNCVNPTVVMTDLGKRDWSSPEKGAPMLARIPMASFADVKDVTEPVLFLLSDKAAMMNGAVIPIEGGFWCG